MSRYRIEEYPAVELSRRDRFAPVVTKDGWVIPCGYSTAGFMEWDRARQEFGAMSTEFRRRWRMRLARERGRHTAREWRAILDIHGHACVACGSQDRITKDHIMPVSRGGSDAADNLQPLCHTCNIRKGNR